MKIRELVTGTLMMLFAAGAFASDPTATRAATAARAWRTAHEQAILQEFTSLLSIPNVASDLPGVRRNAAAIVAMLQQRGAEAHMLELPGVPPLVVADIRAPHATRTIGFYAHYDGQPVTPADWTSPPWQPVIRPDGPVTGESRIYARSASDDKAPIIAMLAALDALKQARIKPSANLKFVFEGEEEAGSPHLPQYFDRYASELHVDGWILADGPVHPSRRMQLFFGARGITGVELTVYGAIRPLHSGNYGNWAPNPAIELARLLASMRDDDAHILIPGFYDDVRALTPEESAAAKNAPAADETLQHELQLGRTEGDGRSLVEQVLAPGLTVRGISSGTTGAQATNAIPSEAHASLDFRLVPDQTPEKVRERLETFIASQGYFVVHEQPDAATRLAHPRIARLDWEEGYPAARTSLSLPISRKVIGLIGDARGEAPILIPSVGGSTPMYLFRRGDTPVVGVPIVNHDNRQHAADENLRLQNLWDGIEVFAALFAGM